MRIRESDRFQKRLTALASDREKKARVILAFYRRKKL